MRYARFARARTTMLPLLSLSTPSNASELGIVPTPSTTKRAGRRSSSASSSLSLPRSFTPRQSVNCLGAAVNMSGLVLARLMAAPSTEQKEPPSVVSQTPDTCKLRANLTPYLHHAHV